MSNKSVAADQVISLPKGGGALKGIGETFQPNLFSGTGNHSVPLAISPGRNGFGPALSLQYSSGNGNSPFGMGWDLSIPRITRKTEKGLPHYNDADVFVMSGAEDLVPCLKKTDGPTSDHAWWTLEDPVQRTPYTVYRYRPRTEGLYARIERWQHTTTNEIHWRAITRDNVTSIYGGTAASQVADPENDQRVYQWLLQETFDATGNHVLYEYAKDDPQLYSHDNPATGLPEIYEQNRIATQLYIRRVYYGNFPDLLLDDQGNAITYSDGAAIGHLRNGRRYAFEVVFDYGDWDIPTKSPHPDPLADGQQELFSAGPMVSLGSHAAHVREDRFSSFGARFEIRTIRRCRRVLMFHHFAELGGPALVRSTDFDYRSDPDTGLSFLMAVTVSGYQRNSSGAYQSARMPPVVFSYSEFKPHEQRYQSLTALGGDIPPLGLSHPNVALVSLFGNGLADVVQSDAAGFRYWRNLGGGLFDRPQVMPHIPAGIDLGEPSVGFGDMGGDGHADLLVHAGTQQGFFETTPAGTWKTFKPYDVVPSFSLSDSNVRLVDLTGDGRSDVLVTEDEAFLWFECLGEKGFAPPQHTPRRHDLEQFPDVFFNDPSERVRLANISGGGLNDIVLIHNGRIDYWPNLGYGQFGKRITMENAPQLDVDFDPKRLFLADVNGTGCADLVYVDVDRVHFWFNQSGNAWSHKQTIVGTPAVNDVGSIQFADVFGTGTTTLLWSYDYAAQPEGNFKALDFCGGVKPYVLTEMNNNLGATTRVRYAPSTKYLLEDQANGTPWLTKLPFPVQVVDKVEVIDHISRTKLVTTYKYHHGYFDGREREFRGFGRVDQFDTETFEDFTGQGLHAADGTFTNTASAYHVPPVETRSWFHTGTYFDEDTPGLAAYPFDYEELTTAFRTEFYPGDDEAAPLDEHLVEAGETPHEAYRALRGALLRTEVYAQDGSAKADHPYQVTENRYRVTQVQPQETNQYGSFVRHPLESIAYHYERNPIDPRISHALTLQVDAFGNALKTLAVGYGRRQPDPVLPTQADRDNQTRTLIACVENTYTNSIDDALVDPDNYRTPLLCESRSYELTGFKPAGNATRFSVGEWMEDAFSLITNAVAISYEASAEHNGLQKRLIEHVRTRYRKNDLTDLLPVGRLESMALPGESYKLAFTPGLLAKVFGARVSDDMLAEGGYEHGEPDNNWWIPTGRVFFSPALGDTPTLELAFARQHFFSPYRQRDQFGNTAFVRYDKYRLLPKETTDPLGNRVTAEHDYRLLQPFRTTDPNGNRSEVAFDILGLVAGTAVMGKSEALGDSLTGFMADPTSQQIEEFLTDPLATAATLLGQATTRIVYDFDRYRRSQQPTFAAVITRETHVSDLLPASELKVQVSLGYSDGFGREIQRKIQAEPGPVPARDANGTIIVGSDGQPMMTPTIVARRWVGGGWTVFNNKSKPVRQFEPFFTDTHRVEFDVRVGVCPVLFYDPAGRVVATLRPDHTWEKVIFDPWRQESWDVTDTMLSADPGTDAHVSGYFSRLRNEEFQPSWYGLRTEPAYALLASQRWPDSTLRAAEHSAALQSSVHAGTPTIAHADALGRVFLTVAHNRFKHRDSPPADPPEEAFYSNRIVVDIEGNQREVIDARNRIVMRYDYDMLGTRVYQSSMEAGERWMLNDVSGKSIRGWDSRGHSSRTEYDELRRPLRSYVTDADPQHPGVEKCTQVNVFGERVSQVQPALNLRGRLLLHCDTAGIVVSAGTNPQSGAIEACDFKGNALRTTRQQLRDYKNAPDWNGVDWNAVNTALAAEPLQLPDLLSAFSPMLEPEFFSSNAAFDALNRPIALTSPDASVYRPIYNEANLLDQVSVNLRGAPTATAFVANIDYDAKGRRTRIAYGNGATTVYRYDPLTLRLSRLITTRPAGLNGLATQLFSNASTVQDLAYTYDPSGNITRIADGALPTLFFDNSSVDPVSLYLYDALYRLIEATGRELIGQSAMQIGLPQATYRDYPFAGLGAQQPFDPRAVRSYREQYDYDEVGNFQHVIHRARNGTWQRDYHYEMDSLIDPGMRSNRPSSTVLHPNGSALTEHYAYDAHGNMTSMMHLSLMQWDFRDQLQASARQVVIDGAPETTWYVYDAGGQRARKVTERHNGSRKAERIYLGGFELYREYGADGFTVNLERESLSVMADKERIAVIDTRTQGDEGTPPQLSRYQLGNYLGSVSLELDGAGQVISYEEYTPYGSTSYQAGHSLEEVSLKRHRYTGMERDEETGLNHHGLRYYATWLGKWTSTDPAGFIDGLNLYCYVSCNPIQFSDPTGTGPMDSLMYYDEKLQVQKQQKAELDKQRSAVIFRELDFNQNGKIDSYDLANWDCIRAGPLRTSLKSFINLTNEHYFDPGIYWLAIGFYEERFGGSGREYNLAHGQWDYQDPSNPRYTREEQGDINHRRYQARLSFPNYVLGQLIPSMGSGPAKSTIAKRAAPLEPLGVRGKAAPRDSIPTPSSRCASPRQSTPNEAAQRVQLVERVQQHVDNSAAVWDNAISRGDWATLGQVLYPKELASVQRGEMVAARRGIFIEWHARMAFAQDPLVQPHIGRGGYMQKWYNLEGKGLRRGFADFGGTPGGLLSGMRIDITSQGGLAAHQARGYLEGQLILRH